MANVKSGNIFYIDATTPTLSQKNIRVRKVVYTPSNATNALILKDVTTGNVILSLSTAVANKTEVFDLSPGVTFPNGINPSTVTAAVATLFIEGT